MTGVGPLEAAVARVVSDPAQARSYYLPVARFCEGVVRAAPRRPAVIGINGPQGGGKSTLADILVRSLAGVGLRGVAISIDDFYLKHDEQRALAGRYPGNRALELRGHPGTHDVALGRATLDSLVRGEPTAVPAYDKSAHGGRGDRGPEGTFRRIEGRLDFVILEGWMLGFRPVDPRGLCAELIPINELLEGYARWHELLDALVRLEARSLDDVVRFRIDAERARRERGLGGLTDEDARDYIERFLPAYRAYLPGLRKDPPAPRVLCVELGEDRSAVRVG